MPLPCVNHLCIAHSSLLLPFFTLLQSFILQSLIVSLSFLPSPPKCVVSFRAAVPHSRLCLCPDRALRLYRFTIPSPSPFPLQSLFFSSSLPLSPVQLIVDSSPFPLPSLHYVNRPFIAQPIISVSVNFVHHPSRPILHLAFEPENASPSIRRSGLRQIEKVGLLFVFTDFYRLFIVENR